MPAPCCKLQVVLQFEAVYKSYFRCSQSLIRGESGSLGAKRSIVCETGSILPAGWETNTTHMRLRGHDGTGLGVSPKMLHQK